MYILTDPKLRMTHTAPSGKNRPGEAQQDDLQTGSPRCFDFEAARNFDPEKDMHMHSGRLIIKDKKPLSRVEWDGCQDGKEDGQPIRSLFGPSLNGRP